MIYIGDNPFKDFFNCNKVGIKTVRVMRGMYKEIKVSKFYDAKIKIKNLSELKKIT
jgi:putative hydrolase of the HAD superfamily